MTQTKNSDTTDTFVILSRTSTLQPLRGLLTLATTVNSKTLPAGQATYLRVQDKSLKEPINYFLPKDFRTCMKKGRLWDITTNSGSTDKSTNGSNWSETACWSSVSLWFSLRGQPGVMWTKVTNSTALSIQMELSTISPTFTGLTIFSYFWVRWLLWLWFLASTHSKMYIILILEGGITWFWPNFWWFFLKSSFTSYDSRTSFTKCSFISSSSTPFW